MALASLLLVSCSSEDDMLMSGTQQERGAMVLNVRDYVVVSDMPGTRAEMLDYDRYQWSVGDVVGIFPYKPLMNSQSSYILTEFYSQEDIYNYGFGEVSKFGQDAAGHVAGMMLGETQAVAKFDGEGWGLIDGEMYVGYYPYDNTSTGHDEPDFCKHIPGIRFDGQVQKGNDNYDHLLAYDHVYAEPAISFNKSVALWFNHTNAIMRINCVNLPIDHKFTKAQLYVESTNPEEDSLFYKSATMDITDWGSLAAVRATDGSEQYLTVDLQDEQGNVGLYPTAGDGVSFDSYLNIYMAVPPTQTKGKSIKVAVWDETDNAWWSRQYVIGSANSTLYNGGVNMNPNIKPVEGFCQGVVYSVFCNAEVNSQIQRSSDFIEEK